MKVSNWPWNNPAPRLAMLSSETENVSIFFQIEHWRTLGNWNISFWKCVPMSIWHQAFSAQITLKCSALGPTRFQWCKQFMRRLCYFNKEMMMTTQTARTQNPSSGQTVVATKLTGSLHSIVDVETNDSGDSSDVLCSQVWGCFWQKRLEGRIRVVKAPVLHWTPHPSQRTILQRKWRE